MKKNLTMLILVAVTVSIITACKSPPPPPAADEPKAESGPILPPEVQVSFSPQIFSPDGDGVDDELTMEISVTSNAPISDWQLLIHDPESPHLTFFEWSGGGMPPKSIVWDGLSASGELVQSAMEYPFTVTVNNIHNDIGTFSGTVQIDVLVHREGDILRMIVPSIVFAPNTGDFKNLDDNVMDRNDRILKRIAEILNKFDTYRVKVEGHANPTTAPGTKARTAEEKILQSLSEERAKAVVDYLVDLGIDRDRLTFVGMGGTRTVVEFTDKGNWWKNRRVEFILEK